MIANYTGDDDDDYLSTLTLDLIDQMEEHLHDMEYVINLIFPNDNESDYVKSFINCLMIILNYIITHREKMLKYIQLINYMELCFHLLIKDFLAIQ